MKKFALLSLLALTAIGYAFLYTSQASAMPPVGGPEFTPSPLGGLDGGGVPGTDPDGSGAEQPMPPPPPDGSGSEEPMPEPPPGDSGVGEPTPQPPSGDSGLGGPGFIDYPPPITHRRLDYPPWGQFSKPRGKPPTGQYSPPGQYTPPTGQWSPPTYQFPPNIWQKQYGKHRKPQPTPPQWQHGKPPIIYGQHGLVR